MTHLRLAGRACSLSSIWPGPEGTERQPRSPAGRRALCVAPGPAGRRPCGAGPVQGGPQPCPAHILPSGSESGGCTPGLRGGIAGGARWGVALAESLRLAATQGWREEAPGSSRQCWSHCSAPADASGEGPGGSQGPRGLGEARAQTRGPPTASERPAVGEEHSRPPSPSVRRRSALPRPPQAPASCSARPA